ncbi:stage II sporulation protein R [Desmospora profundinema]|uniref:Stage II sporulation protein R n=1 Tax=Desmospora profundinema TaxID=1571184 RepID=A0ABU1IL37_9BACL|nr:stage II sporulation protein R [Desmospora profundinema]MDR6225496.1 stage II sporulation protein R [Desmospora profundinema]
MKVWTYLSLVGLAVASFVWMGVTDGGIPASQAFLPVEMEAQGEQAVPDRAIRLRILANSDSLQDQALKRNVRDAVIREMDNWSKKPRSIEEARDTIQNELPRIERLAKETLREHGSNQTVKIQYGMVPFPTKLYGDQVYPAGEYEALLITIGEGKGDNWWCVLFPPLCFVDMSNGDAVPESESALSAQAMASNQAWAAPNKRAESVVAEKNAHGETEVEVRWFLLESLEGFFSSLFGTR